MVPTENQGAFSWSTDWKRTFFPGSMPPMTTWPWAAPVYFIRARPDTASRARAVTSEISRQTSFVFPAMSTASIPARGTKMSRLSMSRFLPFALPVRRGDHQGENRRGEDGLEHVDPDAPPLHGGEEPAGAPRQSRGPVHELRVPDLADGPAPRVPEPEAPATDEVDEPVHHLAVPPCERPRDRHGAGDEGGPVDLVDPVLVLPDLEDGGQRDPELRAEPVAGGGLVEERPHQQPADARDRRDDRDRDVPVVRLVGEVLVGGEGGLGELPLDHRHARLVVRPGHVPEAVEVLRVEEGPVPGVPGRDGHHRQHDQRDVEDRRLVGVVVALLLPGLAEEGERRDAPHVGGRQERAEYQRPHDGDAQVVVGPLLRGHEGQVDPVLREEARREGEPGDGRRRDDPGPEREGDLPPEPPHLEIG